MNGGRILLINNEGAVSRYLRDALFVKRGYNVSLASSAHAGFEMLKKNNFDLIIAKFGMKDLDGMQMIRDLRRIDKDCVIILILDEANPEALQQVFRLGGVYDYISKPINLEKLYFSASKGIELHSVANRYKKLMQGLQEQNMSLQKQNVLLAKRIEESTKNLTRLYDDLRDTYMRTIKSLAQAIEARDHYTHSHSKNVARYAVAIAEKMLLPTKDVELIREACELHDLGKIGIQDYILEKTGSLTSEEWEQIRQHSLKGAQILEPLTFLDDVIELVKEHHERFDGKGYPEGRKGEAIALGARIIHLADAYDAMVSARSYRKTPLSKQEAINEIKRNSGSQFDPKVVEAFLKIVGKL